MSELYVPGQGPPNAAGMIVGEAPGFEEEKQHVPFVGQSGQFLFLHLGALGLRRENLYVTNVVKAVPLDSAGRIRKPNEREIGAWQAFLDIEIQNVAPKAILCLGRTAVDHLMPKGTQFGEHWEAHFAAWHPAHLLYDEDPESNHKKRLTWVDQLMPFAEAVHDAEA